MRFIPHISTPKKDWYGITYIAHIKDNVRMFLQCGLLIANRLEELAPVYMEKFKKSLHIPQVIPQLKMKIRAVTFGTTQIAELCKLVVNQMPLEKCSFLLDVTEIPNSSELKVENAQKKLTHARKEIVSLKKRLDELSVPVNEKEKTEVLKKTKKLNKRKREEKIAEKIVNQKRKKQKICELNPLQSISLEQWKKLVPIVLPRLFVPHTQGACSCHKMHCV